MTNKTQIDLRELAKAKVQDDIEKKSIKVLIDIEKKIKDRFKWAEIRTEQIKELGDIADQIQMAYNEADSEAIDLLRVQVEKLENRGCKRTPNSIDKLFS